MKYLPDNINEIEYICSYQNKSSKKISHIFAYELFIIVLEKVDEYYFEILKYDENSSSLPFIELDKLKYLDYKYETEEINKLLNNINLIFEDFDTTIKKLINKSLVYKRKYKIKKILK